jgi:hypothetical protein
LIGNKNNYENLTRSLPAILLFFVCSCSAFRIIDMNKVSVGMDKATAYKSLGRQPDAVNEVKQYPAGTLEVVEYSGNVPNGAGVVNDKIDQANMGCAFSTIKWYNMAALVIYRTKKIVFCQCNNKIIR